MVFRLIEGGWCNQPKALNRELHSSSRSKFRSAMLWNHHVSEGFLPPIVSRAEYDSLKSCTRLPVAGALPALSLPCIAKTAKIGYSHAMLH